MRGPVRFAKDNIHNWVPPPGWNRLRGWLGLRPKQEPHAADDPSQPEKKP